MKKSIIIVIASAVIVILVLFVLTKVEFDDIDPVLKRGNLEWAGYMFEIASSGDVVFDDSGFRVENDGKGILTSLATSRLTEINLNQRVRVTVVADMHGKYVSGDWSEFAIYIRDSRTKAGIALMGSRDNVKDGNVREDYSFDWFSIENLGNKIIFTDSNGRVIIEDKDTDKPSSNNVFTGLNQNEDWNLGIHCDVDGVGFCDINIKQITAEYP